MSRRDNALTRFCGATTFRARVAPDPGPPQLDKFSSFLLVAPVLLFSMVAHEYAHGYAALKQGDATALQLGRLTWNPAKHVDPFMTLLLPVMLALAGQPILGGAKPVPVVARNYRHYKRGDIIVSLAGVGANLLIALLLTAALVPLGILGHSVPATAPSVEILQAMFARGVIINFSLIAFNLLPIPPLDGSHVFKYLLPPAWALQYQRVGFFGLFLLIIAIQTSLFARWMAPAWSVAFALLGTVDRGGFVLAGAAKYFQ